MPKAPSKSTNQRIVEFMEIARELANELHHKFLQPEHLLYAVTMLDSNEFLDATKLRQTGLTSMAVRRAIVAKVGEGDAPLANYPSKSGRAEKVDEKVSRDEVSRSDSIGKRYLQAILLYAEDDPDGIVYEIIRELTGRTPKQLATLFI